MEDMTHLSEVARLTRQIELETQAAQLAMNGFAAVAKHEFITHRYDAIGQCQRELEGLVGEQQATVFMISAYKKSLDQEGEPMQDTELKSLSEPKAITTLTTPPIIPEALETISTHCQVEDHGTYCVVHFPEGTTRQEIFPRTWNTHYLLSLPDGYRLREMFDRNLDQSVLFLFKDRQ
jgi:hypothetical protein